MTPVYPVWLRPLLGIGLVLLGAVVAPVLLVLLAVDVMVRWMRG